VSNIFSGDSSGALARQLLEARLREELRRGAPPKASESDVAQDWDLLQQAQDSASQLAERRPRPLQLGVASRPERAGNLR
jgi:hypothetical protein